MRRATHLRAVPPAPAAPRPRGEPEGESEPVVRELLRLRAAMLACEEEYADEIRRLPRERRPSARNLVHYVGLRRHDIRGLQEELARLGLSSLGRAEAHVLSTLDSVLRHVDPAGIAERDGSPAPVDFRGGRSRLASHTDALLGPPRSSRGVRIMVTMPGEAARDYALVRQLVAEGMDVMRVNCAHDTPDEWGAIIEKLRRAERDVGHPCRVLMDLAGPKLRTGAVEGGPAVVDWHPARDLLGLVVVPARVLLHAADQAPTAELGTTALLPVPGGWLASLRKGDTISFEDARGAKRRLTVVAEARGLGFRAEAGQSAWVTPGTVLRCRRSSSETTVGELAPADRAILLRVGDTLVLTRDPAPGREASLDPIGRVVAPAFVSCTLPEVFGMVRPGERIFFDDGKIGGVIRSVEPDHLRVEITQGREKGERLRSDKGINLPDSTLDLPALTPKDVDDLAFVAKRADLVGLSFVQRASDVEELRSRLARLRKSDVGVVLKIETRRAFEALPELMLAALRMRRSGVMIARGDLLVECGFERLAEIQEEILWLCEAAHLPVVWATQVLDGLTRKGTPSRAEITDAAMGERAECVMLNKGPHIVEAIRVLDSILRRMQAHQAKKSPRLRRLHF